MASDGKKVLIKLGKQVIAELDHIAEYEGRSRSDLIREAVNKFLNENVRRKQLEKTA